MFVVCILYELLYLMGYLYNAFILYCFNQSDSTMGPILVTACTCAVSSQHSSLYTITKTTVHQLSTTQSGSDHRQEP